MLRLGIVDFDSSHAIEFTRRFNHCGVDRDQHVTDARVVAGCPGSSEMAPERISELTDQVAGCGVELFDSPTALVGRIDAVLVLSLCGSSHLHHARRFLEARIPTFVDKPFACSLDDARTMINLSAEHETLLFSSSALPFAEEVTRFQQRSRELGNIHGVVCYGPAHRADGNPGLFHYGIHATSILYELFGPGCEQLATIGSDGADVVTAR